MQSKSKPSSPEKRQKIDLPPYAPPKSPEKLQKISPTSYAKISPPPYAPSDLRATLNDTLATLEIEIECAGSDLEEELLYQEKLSHLKQTLTSKNPHLTRCRTTSLFPATTPPIETSSETEGQHVMFRR